MGQAEYGWGVRPVHRPARRTAAETQVRHRLAAPDITMLIRTVIGDRIVDRADVIPQQHVALGPAMRVTIFRLNLVREQKIQQRVTFGGRQAIDPHRVAWIGIQQLPARQRVGQHHRLRHWRLAPTLRLGQFRARGSVTATGAHHLPKFFEIMRRGQRFRSRLQRRRQVVVRRRHIAEFGVAERAAVALRDFQCVQHVHERDGSAEAHVGVPVLAGIAEADRPPVLHMFDRIMTSG